MKLKILAETKQVQNEYKIINTQVSFITIFIKFGINKNLYIPNKKKKTR